MAEITRNEGFETKTTETTISAGAVAGGVAGGVFFGFFSILYVLWVILFVVVWFVGGILAFLASFGCMFYNSSSGDKVAGFLLALFTGPFYWFFYIYKSSYCNSYQAYMPMVNYYN